MHGMLIVHDNAEGNQIAPSLLLQNTMGVNRAERTKEAPLIMRQIVAGYG